MADGDGPGTARLIASSGFATQPQKLGHTIFEGGLLAVAEVLDVVVAVVDVQAAGPHAGQASPPQSTSVLAPFIPLAALAA